MRILAVGVATVDIVNEVECYPKEDQEVRALRQRIVRGGNAANSLVALSQLGHACSWAGMIADDREARYIAEDFKRYAVGMRYAVTYPGGRTPVSYITLSRQSGSRTIVHYRELPEYAARHFASVDLERYDWVHFEGRNVPELASMLKTLAQRRGPPCSLEVEKPRVGIEALLAYPELLLFGRPYTEALGFTSAERFLASADFPVGRLGVCAWGEKGAWGRTPEGRVFHCPATEPERLIDTLGAGDVFNAAVIDARLRDADPVDMVASGCRLAGRKCGIYGMASLKILARSD